MRSMISAPKEEVKSKDTLLSQITELSTNVNHVGDYYLFSPKPGKLFDLLKLMRDHRINYTTNFNINDEIVK